MGAHPLSITVCAKGGAIGSGPQWLQSRFIWLDTGALGIHAPIPPVGAKGGGGIHGYYGVVEPLRLDDAAPCSGWLDSGYLVAINAPYKVATSFHEGNLFILSSIFNSRQYFPNIPMSPRSSS